MKLRICINNLFSHFMVAAVPIKLEMEPKRNAMERNETKRNKTQRNEFSFRSVAFCFGSVSSFIGTRCRYNRRPVMKTGKA